MRSVAALVVLTGAGLLGGCATTAPTAASAPGAAATASTPSKSDPWESFNRKIFAFNQVVDDVLLKPVAEGYQKAVPSLVRAGVGNVFSNVGDAWSSVNHLLQGHVQSSLEMGTRFLANTTLGLGGVLDPATEMGLERKREDFGQTLGVWGVPAGPYFVIPFLGASSVRDGLAFTLDREASLGNLFTDRKYINWLTGLELVQVRADLLPATRMIDQIALDKYSFVRDAYLARRLSLVYDGNPPEPDAEPAKAAPVPK